MKRRNGFVLPIILLVVVVLLVVGAIVWVHYYYLPRISQNTGATQSVATSSPSSTSPSPLSVAMPSSSVNGNTYAGWQTYNNTTGAFSVLYPPQYKVQSKLVLSNSGQAEIYASASPTTPLVSISYFSEAQETPQSVFDLALSAMPAVQKEIPSLTYSTTTFMVGGAFPAQGILVSAPGQDGATYIFGANGEGFQITVDYDAGGSGNAASNKALADSIMATFKMVSPSSGQTSNANSWQSYTDSQFGVTFPYPPGYWVQTSLDVANSEDITVRPTNEPQTSGIQLLEIDITPTNTNSAQSEVVHWTGNLQSGRYAFSTSTAIVAGYPATTFALSKPSDNGALYVFSNGTYTFVVSAYYDNASSLPNSSANEATNQATTMRMIDGLSVQ